MKKILTTLIATLMCVCAFSQEHLTFKGVPIDGDAKEFCNSLKKYGYTFQGYLNSWYYEGKFAGIDCTIWVFSTDVTNTVWRIAVVSDDYKDWESAKRVYSKLKDAYNQKYGEGMSLEVFGEDYSEGDGREISAINEGKGYWSSLYKTPQGSIAFQIKAESSSACYIVIAYEDAINSEKQRAEKVQLIIDDI